MNGIGVIFSDPFANAFTFALTEFSIAVFIELVDYGSFNFFALPGDGFTGGSAFVFAEFSVVVGIEALEHLGVCGLAAFLHGGFSCGAFFFIEFSVSVLVEFLDEVLGWTVTVPTFVRFSVAVVFSVCGYGACYGGSDAR